MPFGDRFHQPDRLVLRHPAYMSEFGDSFFCSVGPTISWVKVLGRNVVCTQISR
jgi:hypothetical protein